MGIENKYATNIRNVHANNKNNLYSTFQKVSERLMARNSYISTEDLFANVRQKFTVIRNKTADSKLLPEMYNDISDTDTNKLIKASLFVTYTQKMQTILSNHYINTDMETMDKELYKRVPINNTKPDNINIFEINIKNKRILPTISVYSILSYNSEESSPIESANQIIQIVQNMMNLSSLLIIGDAQDTSLPWFSYLAFKATDRNVKSVYYQIPQGEPIDEEHKSQYVQDYYDIRTLASQMYCSLEIKLTDIFKRKQLKQRPNDGFV